MIDIFESPAALLKAQTQNKKKWVLTIGNFDGVHLGHQTIFSKVTELAASNDAGSVIYTFKRHPRALLTKQPVLRIMNYSEKMKAFAQSQIDAVVYRNFWEVFNLSWRDFWISEFKDMNISDLVVGHDFHFGKDGQGHLDELKALSSLFDFQLHVVAPVSIDNIRISSTMIRELIHNGEMARVAQFLGRPYKLDGIVVPGDKFGRTMGFPTANIKVNHELIPRSGVYAGCVTCNDGCYFGAAYVGTRPTFKDKPQEVKVEVFLFDTQENLYNKHMDLELIQFIRPDHSFDSTEELRQQIEHDVEKIKKIFADRG